MSSGDFSDERSAVADGARKVGAPPPGLAAFWSKARPDLLGGDTRWRVLSGGWTNAVWRVSTGADTLVVKLYRPDAATPLFANDPDAEVASLRALAGTGLAPELLGWAETPLGRSLVYRHVAGRPWGGADDPAIAAAALARLHDIPAPAILPCIPPDPDRLRSEARAMLEGLGEAGDALAAIEPAVRPEPPAGPPVFTHGDATAANVLVSGQRATLIDWQCPVIGDAADDLAVFLSPAMQAVSGNRPLSQSAEAAFLDGYAASRSGGAGAVVVDRYRARTPVYHWRMAVYATWRARRGDGAYTGAADREIAQLRAVTAEKPRQG